MNFQVFWGSRAEAELAAVWLDADDRNTITTAAHRVDSILRMNPDDAGESRDEDQRILLEPPWGVMFSVSSQDRTVRVLTVWRFDSRRDT